MNIPPPWHIPVYREMARIPSEDEPWFYRIPLPDGRILGGDLPHFLIQFHEDRRRMLERALRDSFPNGFAHCRALDIACHQGYFSLHLAQLGLRQVLGIDARQQHLRQARRLARWFHRKSMRFRRIDIDSPAFDTFARRHRFDVVVAFGILYHVENPVGLIRRLRALTGSHCVIETQTFSHTNIDVPNGLNGAVKRAHGLFAVMDEREELTVGNAETGIGGLGFYPTPEAVEFLLRTAGFRSVERIVPPADAGPELRDGSRVLFVARP